MVSMEIAKRIITIRKENGLTQTEFAERLNTTRPKIAAYELNRVNFDSAFLDYICKVFKINPEWLATGQGDMLIQSKQSFVEKLSAEYGLSMTAQKIIECYLNLDEGQQATVDSFFKIIAESIVDAPVVSEEAARLTVVDEAIDKIDIWRAAKSDDNAPPERINVPAERIKKLEEAPEADEI